MKQRLAISIREAAELLGLSTSTIRKWIRDGKIRAIKLGEHNASRILIPYEPFAEQFGGVQQPRRHSDAERKRRVRQARERMGI